MRVSVIASQRAVKRAFEKVLGLVCQMEMMELQMTRYSSSDSVSLLDDFLYSWPAASCTDDCCPERFLLVVDRADAPPESAEKIIAILFLLGRLRWEKSSTGVVVQPFSANSPTQQSIRPLDFPITGVDLATILQHLCCNTPCASLPTPSECRLMYMHALYHFAHEMKNGVYYRAADAGRRYDFFSKALTGIQKDAQTMDARPLEDLIGRSLRVLTKWNPQDQEITDLAAGVDRDWEAMRSNPPLFTGDQP